MPTFEYQAVDGTGSTVTGNAVGANLENVLSDLGNRGLKVERINVAKLLNDPLADVATVAPPPVVGRPVEVPRAETPPQATPSAGPPGDRTYLQSAVLGPLLMRPALKDIAFFFRQFATMQNAGVPINQSLDTLANQSRDPRLQPVVAQVRDSVRMGHSVSSALERYPDAITPVMISVIRVGEEGGFFADALGMVADYIDREIKLRQMYQRATFYPKLVLAVSFIIIGAVNTIIAMVAPGQPGLSSPLALGTWLFLAAAAAGIWLFLRVGLANPDIRRNFDAFVLRIPWLGFTMHQLAMAKFGRAFGAMYKAGVPITKSLPLAADACGNEALRMQMKPHLHRMESGEGIFSTLAATGAFSPIVLDMIATGERTGNLDQMLAKVSDYYELEAENRQYTLATVTGVVIFLIVAIYVGFMIIKFWVGFYGPTAGAAAGAAGSEDMIKSFVLNRVW